MKKKIITAFIILLPIVIYLGLRSDDEGGNESYEAKIQEERREKEDFMKTSASSPFQKIPDQYKPLKYFQVNSKYKVKAEVEKINEISYVSIGESDGSTKRYVKYAWLHFKIDEKPLKLLVLKPTGFGQMNVLFTAFADDTSGEETYGAGRYYFYEGIPKGDTWVIDFNKLYNPYCAYSDRFDCPKVPEANHLDIPLKVGMKDYQGH